jgi:hypothetical protein
LPIEELRNFGLWKIDAKIESGGSTMVFGDCLGSFWSVERGLLQLGGDKQAIANYLFPDLHSLRDAGVAKKITAVIHQNLPAGCPVDIANSLTAKSTWRGSMTQISTHRNICGLDLAGRSGHATGTSIDSYLDKSYIVGGLRGAMALNGFNDVDADIKVPRLEALGAHASTAAQQLMSKLFVVSVATFSMRGELHIVLWTCTA